MSNDAKRTLVRPVNTGEECPFSDGAALHKAIKEFFPRAQLFVFTGTPIFDQNAAQQKVEDTQASMKTTEDLFQKRLHTYTITHAIENGNVLRFHVNYFKPHGKTLRKPGEPLAKKAVIEAILAKHDAATGRRRFNALLATASISDAIEYNALFKTIQAERQAADPEFQPLNIACVFSPPAEGNPDVKQIQEDLPQGKEDNAVEPGKKKEALKAKDLPQGSLDLQPAHHVPHRQRQCPHPRLRPLRPAQS